MTLQPTLRKPTDGRTIAVVGDVYRFLATGDDTIGKHAMLKVTIRHCAGTWVKAYASVGEWI